MSARTHEAQPGTGPADGWLSAAVMITARAPRGEAVRLETAISLGHPARQVRSARLRATAHGVYEIRLDGDPVDDEVLAPGWAAYEWRLPVRQWDVTDRVHDGLRISALLGNGWWRGGLGFWDAQVDYGADLGFMAQLDIEYFDGSTQTLATGAHWDAFRTDVTENSLYHGQTIDARRRQASDRLAVQAVELDRSRLVPAEKPPVARQERLRPRTIWRGQDDTWLVDFGQNLAGWTVLRASGETGQHVRLKHVEVLEDGVPSSRPLRLARATDTFVLSGAGEDEFEPTLTYHGFRYVEVSNYPGELRHEDIEAVVVHSQMRRTGRFECSDPLVNRLVENCVWSQRGNFVDVPTDCPQRDERLGWTGDIAVFAATACFQFDCADLLHGWLLDVEAETRHAGIVPLVVPDVLKRADPSGRMRVWRSFDAPTSVWGDAAVWVPHALWSAYGDLTRLARHYPLMVAHLTSVLDGRTADGLWTEGQQLGDWLDPDAPPDRPGQAKADPEVVATACLYRDACLTAEAAQALGLERDVERWTALAERTREAFGRAYVSSDGTVRSDAQTVYALAIHFGLLDGEARLAAGRRLAELVAENGHRVGTGFAGAPYLLWALSGTGHVDVAYRLLLQTAPPSWLYAVTMDATTVWERWDSLLPDGSVNPGEMTSFNHYALGAVAGWLYGVVAGIAPSTPGYAGVVLRPTPGPGLTWARGSLETSHGLVESGWRIDEGHLSVLVRVPEGVTAELVLPTGDRETIGAGEHERVVAWPVDGAGGPASAT